MNTGNVLYRIIRLCVHLWTGLSWLGIGSSDGLMWPVKHGRYVYKLIVGLWRLFWGMC